MSGIFAFIRGIEMSGRIICVITLAILFVGLLANVVLRYCFGAGLGWAYDMHAILLPWLIAGGVVLATVHNRNIAITILLQVSGSASFLRALRAVIYALTAIVSIVVVIAAVPIISAATHQHFSALWGLSAAWGYASLIYGFGAIAVVSILDVIVLLRDGTNRAGDAAGSLS